MMLWYCRYTWQPHTTRDMVWQRILEMHEKGLNQPESIRGWYALVGGGAGFMLVEQDDPQKVTAALQPYMDLVSWDVHAIYEMDYDESIRHFQDQMTQSG